jgi:hypothetical protein
MTAALVKVLAVLYNNNFAITSAWQLESGGVRVLARRD